MQNWSTAEVDVCRIGAGCRTGVLQTHVCRIGAGCRTGVLQKLMSAELAQNFKGAEVDCRIGAEVDCRIGGAGCRTGVLQKLNAAGVHCRI